MKEKYIFLTLLVIALAMLVGSRVGRSAKSEISAEEKALERKLEQFAQRRLAAPQKIEIDKLQNLLSFTYYEGMLKRSPFFKVQPKVGLPAQAEGPSVPVEDQTPVFVYKGKIASGGRLTVIIAQTRSGEVFMVSRGDSVDGYKVLDITNTEVILSKKGAENIVLKTLEKPGI